MSVRDEIKTMWMDVAVGIYGSDGEAAAAFDRVDALIRQRDVEERDRRRAEVAKRRAEIAAKAYRGAQPVATTCGVCGTQHPGEC
jgi:hypothetical protein